MASKTISLLHISDLHIEYDIANDSFSPFHQNLKHSIIKEFTEKSIDFLIVSGDLGNRGDNTNMDKAIHWIEELKSKLYLDNSQLIFCAGNHDLVREQLIENHHKMCLNYVSGQEYITNKTPFPAFEPFYQKIERAFPTQDGSKIYKTELNDYIYDTGDVRFYCLNSSWLSQINDKEEKRIKEYCTATTEISQQIDFLNSEFNNTVCLKPNNLSRIDRFSFNHSENTRQQIDFGFIELFEKIPPDDTKLNILVFHHPEFCLNPLEHFTLNGIDYSGSYQQISSKVDILFCGHIHPDFPQEIKNRRYKIPHFIGATGHDDPNKDKNRPIFFHYEFTLENKAIQCKRAYYKQSEDGKYFQPYLKTDSFNIEKRNYAYAPSNNNTNIRLNSESDIHSIIEKIRCIYFKEFESYLYANKVNYHKSKFELQIPNKTENPDYFIINYATKYTLNNEFEIIFDIISSNIFLYPNYLQCRFDKLLRQYNDNLLKDDSKKCLYLPIVLDLYSSLLGNIENNAHKMYCETEMKQYYNKNDVYFTWLTLFLRRKLKNLKWSTPHNILQMNNMTFVGEKLIRKILANDRDEIYINLEANVVDLLVDNVNIVENNTRNL